MAAIQSFRDIIAWQKSHEFVLEIYKITEKYPQFEQFGLANQMRRCAVSIPSNIAEGFKRKGSKDSCHFYNISEGSLEELKYQIILSCDLKYISETKRDELLMKAEEIGKVLWGWIKIQK